MAKQRTAPEAVRIGTSGWHYDHWRGVFYPPDLAAKDMLASYARHFSTVEINNSFYRLPSNNAVSDWLAQTPDDFIFACKASRYTTHVKRLKDAPECFAKFFPPIERLGSKLGPILFQTPPRFAPDTDRLEAFIQALPNRHLYAFEFRDQRWFRKEVYEILRRHNCAFCIFDIGGLQSPFWVTADFAYLRLHGPGAKYQGSYSDESLLNWASQIRSLASLDVYCYFDNDQAGFAIREALRLRRMLGTEAL
jgi:uncharacterized protein YecE (DUF72 family)